MENSIKMSVIMPVFNGSRFLKDALSALRHQSMDPKLFELIAVDDGSTDHSLELLHALARENKSFTFKILTQSNKGVSAARNAGVAAAKGVYIAFFDQDAQPDENWLELGMRHFEEDPELAMVEGAVIPIHNFEPTPFTHILKNETGGRYLTTNTIFNRKAFESVGGFDERFPYYIEDTDLAYTLIENGLKIRWCPDVIMRHPYVEKTVKQHIWISSYPAAQLPLLFKKHKINREFYQKYSIPRLSIIGFPPWYHGYYLAPLLALTGCFISGELGAFILLLSAMSYFASYFFTLFLKFRRRKSSIKHFFSIVLLYFFVPYLYLFQIIRGAIKYRAPIPFP